MTNRSLGDSPHLSMNISLSKYASRQKIVLLGDDNVGKSSLLNRLVNPGCSISSIYAPTDEVYCQSFQRETRKYGSITGEIWDHPGDLLTLSRTDGFLSSYFDDVDGIVMVYDVTDKKSFEHLASRWITMFEDHEKASKFYSAPKILVGNKMDKRSRDVPVRSIKKFCKSLNNILHLEASARTGGGVDIVFESLIKAIENKNLSRYSYESPKCVMHEPNYEILEFDWIVPCGTPRKKMSSTKKEIPNENGRGFNFLCNASRVLCYSDDF